MMKMMILAPRRPGMSHAEFRRYVVDVHGPLVRSVPEVADAIRHYHYNFPIAGASDTAFHFPTAHHLDIVTQGWFDSREAQLENMAQPRYFEIIRPDEHRFADGANAVMHYTAEVPVSAGADGGTKVFYFRRRRPHLSREAFQSEWRTRFADALIATRGFRETVASYVQNHTLPEADHPNGASDRFFDVIDELVIHSPGDLRRIADVGGSLSRVRAIEADLLEPSRTLALVTERVVNIP